MLQAAHQTNGLQELEVGGWPATARRLKDVNLFIHSTFIY